MEKKEIKKIDRRRFLKYSAAGAVALSSGSLLTGLVRDAFAAEKGLTIAYTADVPSWDAQNSVFPTPQSLWKCVFDQFTTQKPDLTIIPEIFSEYGYTDKAKLRFEAKIQKGVRFHNGDELTAEDVKFSFDRMKSEGMVLQFIWGAIEETNPFAASCRDLFLPSFPGCAFSAHTCTPRNISIRLVLRVS